MKLLKLGLRFWITITSIFSFLLGWAMLSHAPKPAQPQTTSPTNLTTVPTLAPLQPLDFSGTGSNNNNGFVNQFFSVQPQQPTFQRSRPLFATGGS